MSLRLRNANGKPLDKPPGEKTTAQILFAPVFDGRAPRPLGTGDWLEKVRDMRRDSTLGFVRDLVAAPLLAAEWTVESDADQDMDEEELETLRHAEDFIYRQFNKHKLSLLRHAINGMTDYGWQSFERVLEIVEGETGDIPMYGIKKFKPLLPDFTEIVIDDHGNFDGLFNYPVVVGFASHMIQQREVSPGRYTYVGEVFLEPEEVLLFTRGVEGQNWYGEPLLRRAERAYDDWVENNDAASRYHNKLAGAHWVVYYPIGSSEYNGTETDNAEIARIILQSLKASGMVAVPTHIVSWVDDLNAQSGMERGQNAWKIEILSAQGSPSATFIDRAKYLDALKARACGIPERAVLEGQFGTKAEAEVHADFAIELSEMWHVEIMAAINEQAVDDLLEVNYGKEMRGRVKLRPAPLSDSRKALIREVYMTLLSTPDGIAEEFDRLDFAAMRDKLGIPERQLSEEEEEELEAKIEEKRDAIAQQMTGGGQGEGTPGEGTPGEGPAEDEDDDEDIDDSKPNQVPEFKSEDVSDEDEDENEDEDEA